MPLDLGRMHAWIVAELAAERPVAESMARLIDECEAAHPHADWPRFRELDYADLTNVVEWIEAPFEFEPPECRLRGLWFGLHNPYSDDGTPVIDLRVSGSARYDPADVNLGWAVRPEWEPEYAGAGSAVLAEIYRIAYRPKASAEERKGRLSDDAEYPLCLGYGAFAVRDALGQVDAALLLGHADSLGVAVGFDSGDFVRLGEFGPDGLSATR